MRNISIIGNLGKDGSTATTANGGAIYSNSISVSRGYGDNQQTVWVNLTAFGNTAQIFAERTKKGTKVAIGGTLEPNVWVDKNGTQHYDLQIVANSVDILSGGNQQTGTAQPGIQQPAQFVQPQQATPQAAPQPVSQPEVAPQGNPFVPNDGFNRV